MDGVTITLAGAPEGKGRPRFARATGRAFTPANTRAYEAALRWAAQEAMGDRPLFTGPVEVVIAAAFPIPKSMSKRDHAKAISGELRPTKKPDADNLMKCMDALNGVVWCDDAQVVEATIRKFYDAKPRLRIMVQPLFGGIYEKAVA